MPSLPLPEPQRDVAAYNQAAWNLQVQRKNQWTIPVTSDEIELARQGQWSIVLTPVKAVPSDWFPDFRSSDSRVLCLAGSGGQQAPILAAAGAIVTVVDLSADQLAQDRFVADRDKLDIETVQSDMRDLSMFDDNTFDLIVHPCSNGFVPDINPVWREAARVLKPGGNLISGFVKPIFYLFNYESMESGNLDVAYSIPYSDLTSIPDELRQSYIDSGEPLSFGHSLTDQLGGQIRAGLVITGYYEDVWPEIVLSQYIAPFAATRATLP